MSMSRRDELLAKLFAAEGKPSVLEGIKVVELSKSNLAGSMVGAMLRELGAEVVKVEPQGGDPAKDYSPYGVNVKGLGIPYLIENLGKKIVHLDLEQEDDREELRKLLVSCDVIIDALKPGYLDSLKLGYRDISRENQRVIYVAISPYGHFSEKAKEFLNVPDSDLTAQSYNGYPSIIGNPSVRPAPLRAGVWAAWMMAAISAIVGTLLALYERLRSGKGQFVDIATHETLAAIHMYPILVGFLFGRSRPQYGFIDYILYPFGIYKVKDGYITIATPFDTDFRALLKVIKRWDLEPDWRYAIDRVTDDIDRIVELEKELKKELMKYSARELIKKATRRAVLPMFRRLVGRPVVVRSYTLKEAIGEKHWYIRGSLFKVSVNGKELMIPNSPFRMSETPGKVPVERLKDILQ
ncbi:MAG: CoA transferase [Candidatus Nezhaarchaeota archaeon]|nr:CoA transferase [Candidatus Nezhaarchaeota archaeon]